MSTVAEIEAAIKQLAPDDFDKLVSRIRVLQAQADKVRQTDKVDFNQAMDKVFDHHAPLLGKLAR